MTESVRTFVYGSEAVALDCVRLDRERFDVSRFVSRQSVISAMSRRVFLEPTADVGVGERRALDDAAGSLALWARLDRDQTDLVVWDLSDERFGIERCGEGAYRTSSPDYLPFREQLTAIGDRKYIPFGTDEHFDLFRLAASRFVALLNAVGLGSKTVVIAPELAACDASGVECIDSSVVEGMRESFRRYYGYLHEVCCLPLILLPCEATQLDSNHRWGVAPFHFTQEVLQSLLAGVTDFARHPLEQSRAARSPVERASYHGGASSEAIELNEFEWADGIHRLSVDGRIIDVLVRFDGRQRTALTPVMFSGALSPGQDVRGPIFSGKDICEQLNLPLVSISDPSIGLCPSIDLAWYAGSQWCPAQEVIHEVLVSLYGRAGRSPLLVGGSGGGFAALTQLARARRNGVEEWGALVWNPQLDIAKYGSVPVSRFLATCFPSTYLRFARKGLGEVLKQIRVSWGTSTELYSAAQVGELSNSFIIQERGDWHYAEYIEPLLAQVGAKVEEDGGWRAEPRMSGFAGDWGGAHTPPPRALLSGLLASAATDGVSGLVDLASSWFSESAD